MNRNIKLWLMSFTLVTLVVGIQTSAQADGFYIGAGVYESEVDEGGLSDDDTVPAVFVGYTFLDSNFLMLSAELGYYDLGEFGEGNVDIEADAFTLGGVLSIPIGPIFEIYAKLGVASVEAEVEIGTFKDDFDDEEAYYGVGVALDIFDTIDIYVEYIEVDNEIDSEAVGVGVRLAF